MESLIRRADLADAAELAALAAATFPLACPPSVAPENMASFIAANLSSERFAEYLSDPHRTVLVATRGGRIIAYAILIHDANDRVELSKMYVQSAFHGSGVAPALMDAAVAAAAECGAASVWLGVNQKNQRAQRFYAKAGFMITGTRTFQLGSHTEHDYVMGRPTQSPPR